MAKDRLKEDAEKSSINRITSLAKAALTVGVGAAVFYRGGGRKILSEGASISSRFLSKTSAAIKSGDLKKAGPERFIKDSINNWSKIATEVRNQQKSMPMMSDRNILGYTQRVIGLTKRPGEKMLEELFGAEVTTQKTYETIKNKIQPKVLSGKGVGSLEELSQRAQRGIERISLGLPKVIDNHNDMQKLLEYSGLNKELNINDLEESAKDVKEILESLASRKKEFIESNKYGSGGIIDKVLDEFLDIKSIEKKYGTTGKSSLYDKIVGDSPLSIGEAIEKAKEGKIENIKIPVEIDKETFLQMDLIKSLENIATMIEKKGYEARKAFEAIPLDRYNLRIKDGEIYSFKDAMDIFGKIGDEFGETVPGRILKTRSLKERLYQPTMMLMPKMHEDLLIANTLTKGKEKSFAIEDNMIRVFDKVFKVSEGNLEHMVELDNMRLIPSRFSSVAKMQNHMLGNANYKESSNIIGRALDIGQSPRYTLFNRLGDMLGLTERSRDHRITRNLRSYLMRRPEELKSMVDIVDPLSPLSKPVYESALEKGNEINMLYRKFTEQLSGAAARHFSEKSVNEKAKSIFELISETDNEKFINKLGEEIYKKNIIPDAMENMDASSIIKKYIRDPIGAMRIAPLRSDTSNFMDAKRGSSLFETLRIELAKEAFIQESKSSKKSADVVIDLLDGLKVSGKEKTSSKFLAEWAIFQDTTGIYNMPDKRKSLEELKNMSSRFADLFAGEQKSEFLETLKKDLFRTMREKPGYLRGQVRSGIFREGLEEIENLELQRQSPNWIHSRKAISPIEAINNKTKAKAFFKQFVAGKKDPENITSMTFPPYFYIHRISEALSSVGLNMSSESMGDVLSYAKNIGLKRVLPIIGGLTYLDYLSDITGRLTGTTLKGHMASGIANVDLGTRTILDKIGIGGLIERERELNPISRYHLGEYMDSDERREWYQDGYSPMRKSRWWNFGSLSEWRGSEIAYFQPNYLRRVHSSWNDAALYDSLAEKWSRSWFPTPTSPLSPIRYLMNPYWLEEKHMEDRPYMMTGKMFSEETPWGVFLNPTLGEIIKPQKRMHEDRLDKNYVDVKWLIEQRNMDQIYKAQNKNEQHMVRIRDGIIENVLYTPFDSPTPSQRIMSINRDEYGNLNVSAPTGYQSFSGIDPARDTIEGIDIAGESVSAYGMSGGLSYEKPAVGLSFEDRINMGAQKGSVVNEIFASIFSPTYDIGIINRSTFQKAAARNNRPLQDGIVTPESINITQARFGSHILENKEALADLKGLSSRDDFIGELAYMGRYMTGLHGYVAYRAFKGQPRTKIEDASGMNSPVKDFWDSNIGGLGGSEMEIIRRFIPFQNRMASRFNPLMNTQDDWLPERFRFGDPFTKLPKGAMRLPGRGYESLNKLNPDEYGEYGAFDRMKILADVSPFSHEYKVWRDIAQRTVQDPYLREQMLEIRNRVTEQSKKYDFYGYRFLGRGLDKSTETIEEVINNNYFTVVGNNEVYRMAGITVSSGEQFEGEDKEGILEQFIKPGMNVTIAIDEDKYKARNQDKFNSINAAVLIDGQNLNKKLVDQKMAEMRENDLSAAAHMAKFGDASIAYGKAMEAIGHAPIPFFQQKFFKIRDPLESYKHEQVYGTSYSSWTSPLKSFLQPSVERSLMSGKEIAVGAAAYGLYNYLDNLEISPTGKTVSKLAMLLTNRGAGIGALIGKIAKFDYGSTAKSIAKFGAIAQVAGYAYTRQNSLIEAPIGFGAIGAYLGTKLTEEAGGKKGALIGAAIGLAVAASKGSILDDDGLTPKWIPERTKEKWDIQEYFDRLDYIKYSGLYEKASTKAMKKEGTNIRGFVNQFEKDKEEKARIRTELEEYKEITKWFYAEGDTRAQSILSNIDEQLDSLKDSQINMTVGKYGRAALIYKQAMDSTIYGLKEGASWSQLLRAVPKNERDHFMAFAKEQNPDNRKEILSYTSPYMKRAYQIAWGEKPDNQESMSSFFDSHYLPAPTWSGWRPETDLQDVQIKTIQNEGQLLSDYGFYESQLRDPDVINAPNLEPDRDQSAALMRTSLVSNLHGLGLTGVNVSIDKTNVSGFQVISNIKRITEYNVEQGVKKLFSFL